MLDQQSDYILATYIQIHVCCVLTTHCIYAVHTRAAIFVDLSQTVSVKPRSNYAGIVLICCMHREHHVPVPCNKPERLPMRTQFRVCLA